MGDADRSPSDSDSDSDSDVNADSNVDAASDAPSSSLIPKTNHLETAWWLALLSPLLVPWVVVQTTDTTLVFAWGMTPIGSGHLTTLPAYLRSTAGLPTFLQMWPVGAACYLAAVGWAIGDRYFGTDQRVTAGLLALAALCVTWMASGLGVEPARTAFPLGTILFAGLALWAYVVRRS